HPRARILDRLPPTRSPRQNAILAARVCWALCLVGDSFLCLACVSARNFSARPYRDGQACGSTQPWHEGRGCCRRIHLCVAFHRFHDRSSGCGPKNWNGDHSSSSASSWVVLGSFLVFLSARWQFPVISSLVILAIIF